MNDLFRQQVYEITKLIPLGRITTYGSLAKAIGFPNHSRHVGHAMGGCPKDVPAHRVISSTGTLSVPSFRERLEKENVTIQENLKVKDFKILFWDPLREL
ncbi:MAG: MGMT family protein [Weeksellaceae bacterium]|nr:MGMT family protein [Weeksellaceae bacterium]